MITQQFLEPVLRNNLLLLARAYIAAKGGSLATLSRAAHGDSPFFDAMEEQAKKARTGRAGSFTIRKYDEVVGWFAVNWPKDVPWPPLDVLGPNVGSGGRVRRWSR